MDYQVGGGVYSGIGRVYVGAPYQRGSGIGSFLGGVFRYVLPFLKRGAAAVSKEALSAGMNIVSDVTEKNASINEAFNSRIRESGQNLKRAAEEKLGKMMAGEGYKIKRATLPSHLFGAVRAVKSGDFIRKRRKRRAPKKTKKKKTKRLTQKRKRKTASKKKKKKRLRSKKNLFNDIFT